MGDDNLVTAIFDIGKTNKKFLLFDQNYTLLYKQDTHIPQVTDDDGDACEDISLLIDWMMDVFRQSLSDSRFSIRALNFSTYGATMVHIDEKGERVTPAYDYFKPFPEELLQNFYSEYGGKEQFALKTASPPMGMLNSGLQLYWLKYRKPEIFDRIANSLHFPQYLSYLFTHKSYTEMTSIGCHTGLWDFQKKDYHDWVYKESCRGKLPEIVPVSDRTDISYHGNNFSVGIGIHDSSASLAPYLYLFREPFILVSTGTWSISLNPFNKNQLTIGELGKDCLNYMNINDGMVRASRFLLGKEYDHQKEKLIKYFDIAPDKAEIDLNFSILKKLVENINQERKLKLETVANTGPYPQTGNREWNPSLFQSYEEAYHQLLLDLVSIQSDSINLTSGNEDISNIFVTGGFSKNYLFMKLLASKFPEKKVFTVNLSDSTALGTAMVVNQNDVNAKSMDDLNLLEMIQFHPLEGISLNKYNWCKEM